MNQKTVTQIIFVSLVFKEYVPANWASDEKNTHVLIVKNIRSYLFHLSAWMACWHQGEAVQNHHS